MMLPLDEWRPDLAPLSPGSEAALNVLPAADGYVPLPMPVFRGPGGLAGTCSWLMVVITGDGLSIPFAFTSSGIFQAGGTGWIEVSRTPGYEATLGWNAVQWGDQVFAVNGKDTVQLSGGGTFGDVAGRTDGLGSRYIAIVGDFLVLASVYDHALANQYPLRVQWSGRLRPAMLDPDLVIQSGYVDRPSIGRIQGITGGEYGLILGEEGLDRMDYVGPPAIWQFRTLETDIGCELARSVVQAGDKVFWWSRRGWRMSQGGPSRPIGLGKVDEWTRARVDFERGANMTATALLRQGAVIWSFVSRDNNGSVPDECLAYSWEHDRWTRGQFAVECLGRQAAPSIMTDDPTWSATFGATTDDSNAITDAVQGGRPFAAAVVDGGLHALQVKSGVAVECITTETQLLPGQRALVSRLRPLVHGAVEVSAYSQTREMQTDERLRTKGPYGLEHDGSMSCHHAARFHRFRLVVRTPFSKIQAMEIPDWAIAQAGRR